MSALDVPAGETGVVRLFAIDLPGRDARAFAGEEDPAAGTAEPSLPSLHDALGATRLDREHVELVATDDLSAIGLSTYLTEGLGVPEEEVAADREAIDALSGHVLVVGSGAFGGTAQRLEPTPPLRLIGTYRERPATPVVGPIESAAARGRLARRGRSVKHAHSSALLTVVVLLVALAAGIAIVLVLVKSLS